MSTRMCLGGFMCNTCKMLSDARRKHWTPGTRVTSGRELQCGCWDPSPGPLQKQETPSGLSRPSLVMFQMCSPGSGSFYSYDFWSCAKSIIENECLIILFPSIVINQDGQPLIEGKLKEKQVRWKFIKRWKTRYFTLAGNQLLFQKGKSVSSLTHFNTWIVFLSFKPHYILKHTVVKTQLGVSEAHTYAFKYLTLWVPHA